MFIPLFGTAAFANIVEEEAKTTQSTILFNNKPIIVNGFNISGNNYFKLRDLAENFSGTTSQFDVHWNDGKNIIEIITGKAYTPVETRNISYYRPNKNYSATPMSLKVSVDGVIQEIAAFHVDGHNYFKLRDLGNLIQLDVEWDDNENTILFFSHPPKNAFRAETANEVSNNIVSSTFPRWSSTITSYLVNNNDTTVSVIEAKNNVVTVETYDKHFNFIEKKSIEFELPLFGGFYSGEEYNYIAFGQENQEENDNKEVIRIARYDKSFKRIDSVSIKGGESFTVTPFSAGSGRMAEYGNTLVFHTSRRRYMKEDGLNHQSQLTIIVGTSTMTVTNNLGRFQRNHVSHSFDQYALFDGNKHVLIDHGDAYPRSIVLHRGSGSHYSKVDLFNIPGDIGANTTGVSIGGFEITSANYIVAMNKIDHSKVSKYGNFYILPYGVNQKRDIILCILPKANIKSASVKQVTIAEYVESNKIGSIPQLIKKSDDELMILWQEFDTDHTRCFLKYLFIDQNGNNTSEINTIKNFVLSKCQPIIIGDRIVWYTNENGMRTFYTIPLNSSASTLPEPIMEGVEEHILTEDASKTTGYYQDVN